MFLHSTVQHFPTLIVYPSLRTNCALQIYVCLSACLYVCLFLCMYICLSVYLPVCLPVCLSVSLASSLFACLPVCLPVCKFGCMSVSICLYVQRTCIFVASQFLSLRGSIMFYMTEILFYERTTDRPRGVQYVHCVMHNCIMVKVGETKFM